MLLMIFSAIACINYRNGHGLATFQDSLIAQYKAGKDIDKKTIRTMKRNWWVRSTKEFTSTNLHIRQFLLIDVFSGKPSDRVKEAMKMINELTYHNGSERIWAEGYSYWLYTLDGGISLWMKKFPNHSYSDSLERICEAVKEGFIITSYFNVEIGSWAPAPFGDLRKIGLRDSRYLDNKVAVVSNVTKYEKDYGVDVYVIKARPVKLNNHVPARDLEVMVRSGVPYFEFYEGYDKKYKDKKAEWKDILNPKRLITLFIW